MDTFYVVFKYDGNDIQEIFASAWLGEAQHEAHENEGWVEPVLISTFPAV